MEQTPRSVRVAMTVRRIGIAILGLPSLVAVLIGLVAGAGGVGEAAFAFVMGFVFMGVLGLFELRALRLPPDPSGRVALLPLGVPHETAQESIRSLSKTGVLLLPVVALATVVSGVGVPALVLGISGAGFLLTLRVERWESREGMRLLIPVGRRIWNWQKPYSYVEPMNSSTSDA